MTSKAAAEIEKLREEIRYHDRKYYVAASPEISDLEYDKLLKRLEELEAQHPELVTPDSPTQRVGGEPVPELASVKHRVPMLSIDNTYSIEDLRKFGQRVEKLLPGEEIEWVLELKIDGVAVSLVYENGSLVQGATRGDGRTGDDITHNLRVVAGVPLRLARDDWPPVLEVRGEVYITNSDLVALNEERTERGEAPYANPRNAAAGGVRLLDARIAAERRMRIFCHGVGATDGLESTCYTDFLAEIGRYGLPPTPYVQKFDSFEPAVEHCEGIVERLHELDFEVDGLVLKVNDFQQRERLGVRSKSPRWMIAYKFEKYEAVTRVNEIRVQVGKTGAVTPVAELEPVELAGTAVARASLHNADEIERKDVRVGDTVVVEKAGKIIPHIVRVEPRKDQQRGPKFDFPTNCPECGTKLVQDTGGVYIRCPNIDCPARVRGRLRYFAGRSAMDIEGLGDKLIDQLVDSGLVRTLGDLYALTAEQLMSLERMGKRSSEKLLANIRESKSRGLERLLNALSIPHVGARVASVLAEHFGSMALEKASVEELAEIEEVGPIIAKSVRDYLDSDFGQRTIEELRSAGVLMESTEPKQPASEELAGKTFVVTGSFDGISRDDLHALIEKHGGRPSSNVSKKTDYLVVGEKAGSKLDKAEKLGVATLSLEEFQEMVGE